MNLLAVRLLSAFLGVVSVVVYCATFRLPVDDQEWSFHQVSVLSCRLTRHVEGLGDVSVVIKAGQVSQLVLPSLNMRNLEGTAEFSMAPESWNHTGQAFELGVRGKESSDGMLFTLDIPPLEWVSMMTRPLQIRLAVYDKSTTEIIRLEMPTTGFSFQLPALTHCLAGLLPYNFEQLKTTVLYFEPGKTELTEAQLLRLADIAHYLEWDGSVVGMSIDSYTDSSGHRLDNLRLSELRGDRVYRYLMSKGIQPTQVINLRHHGQRYPIAENGTKQGRDLNRRVEITLKSMHDS